MAQSASLQTQGIEKLLKKLDARTLTAPAQGIVLRVVAASGASFLAGALASKFPETSHNVHFALTGEQAKILAPRHPYVFFERGSVYPRSVEGQKERKHSRRANVKQGALRIKARRYLAKTRAKVRQQIPGALEKAAREIEKVWAS